MGNSFDFETIKANVIEQMKASPPPLSCLNKKKDRIQIRSFSVAGERLELSTS